MASSIAGLSASAETSAAAGLSASAETQPASGGPPHGSPKQERLDDESAFSTINEGGMYVMAEQDVTRTVQWLALIHL